jgi:hypothetical protein
MDEVVRGKHVYAEKLLIIKNKLPTCQGIVAAKVSLGKQPSGATCMLGGRIQA